ncbi:MAG: ABC transporter ATP-binding protein [Firmicutes bacterium]|nr:ABC transporter ATP-binding protein [Bacillota bacterium]
MTQLKLDNVSVGYGGTVITDELTFEINEGDYLCVAGENGAGKTTLIKSMLGLINILKGKISYGEGFKKSDIGYLPQHRELQKDFPASVTEIVLSGFLNKCGFRPFYSKKEKETAKEIMEKVGISEISKECYRELSGGQQQRVLLARALCASSKMILLDEPVSGLDPDASAEMYRLIEKLNKEDKVSVIMISHDIEQAKTYASHVLTLERGGYWSYDAN